MEMGNPGGEINGAEKEQRKPTKSKAGSLRSSVRLASQTSWEWKREFTPEKRRHCRLSRKHIKGMCVSFMPMSGTA